MDIDKLDKEVTRLLEKYKTVDPKSADGISIKAQISKINEAIRRTGATNYDYESATSVMDHIDKNRKPNLKLLKGGKSAIGPIGLLLGLTAPDVAEAVLPTGDVHTDKAIEDPSSPEFKKRRSLLESLRGK